MKLDDTQALAHAEEIADLGKDDLHSMLRVVIRRWVPSFFQKEALEDLASVMTTGKLPRQW